MEFRHPMNKQLRISKQLLTEEIGGDALNYYKYEDKINKVKLEEVKALSKLKGYSFVALLPEEG